MMIREGFPTEPGLYVAYVNDDVFTRFAKRIFLTWHDGRWSYPLSDQVYRDHVYGWVGPLPAMELED